MGGGINGVDAELLAELGAQKVYGTQKPLIPLQEQIQTSCGISG